MTREALSWVPDGDGDTEVVATSAGGHDWLASTPVALGLIGLYLTGHLALRWALSPTLGIDDAEQVLFAQQWAFGYRFRQPPLFTWLLMPATWLAGPGVLAVGIVRYGLLALTYLCLYLTARRWIHDRRLAALSVLSFSLIYVFAYYAHHDLTHTTALGAMVALSYYLFDRLARRPTALNYLLLGLCFGLGMLAKWNFVMLALGLPLTCLALTGFRYLILTWKIVLAAVAMVTVATPSALWIFQHGQTALGISADILNQGDAAGGPMAMLEGARALLISTFLFPLPFLPIFLAIFGPSLARGVKHPVPLAKTAVDVRFLGALILIMLGLHALLIPLLGATAFTERWMHPALMVLPLFLFALAERGRPSNRSIAIYLTTIAILVAVAAGARLYRYLEGADQCSKCREFVPFADMAAELRTAGFTRGTIVADGMHMGGNLKMLFSESRVIDPAFPLALWPDVGQQSSDGDGTCLLLWRDDRPDSALRRAVVEDFATTALGVPSNAPRKTGRVEAPLYQSSSRTYALGFHLIRKNTGACR